MAVPDIGVATSLWFVTVTVAGDPVEASVIRSGLECLSHEHPFLLSGRYASDRAEVRYWEEARDAQAAFALERFARPRAHLACGFH